MKKFALNPDALLVDSFDTVDSEIAAIGPQIDCTGCDSTCGIVWP